MASPSWFNFRAAADSLVIDITDEIGMWGVSAKDFAHQLKAVPNARNITLNIDCPGGDCNDGFTIYDAITGTGAEVTVNITGLAASMASVIMLAGKTINIAENGRVMIHRVTGGASGNADEMDAAAKLMKQFEDRIVGLYIARTGKDEEEIRDLMKAQMGTWFFGQEAVDAGFADKVIKSQARNFNARWASMFTMLPAALFDTQNKGMKNSEEETPIEQPATEIIEQVVTPAEPEISTPEEMVEAEQAPAPEAKGILERIAAAFSGDAALKSELTNLRASIAQRDAEVASLKNEIATLKPKADERDAIHAKLAEAEAKAKTVGQAAAEIAAAHGLKPDALAGLPTPTDSANLNALEEYDSIVDPAVRSAFLKKNKAAIMAALNK